jgi:hypothetical protein
MDCSGYLCARLKLETKVSFFPRKMNESFLVRARLLTHIDSIAWVMKSFLLVFIPISITFLLLLVVVVVVRGDDRCCGRMKEERVRNASAMRCISCADIFQKKGARYYIYARRSSSNEVMIVIFTRSSSSIKIQKGTSPKPNHSMKSVISSRRPFPLFSLSFRDLSFLSLVLRARKL